MPRQTGAMGMRRLALAVCALALVTASACGGGDDDSTTQFTPAPTGNDPGPNATSNAPQTVQGTVRLDAATGCIALETETVTLAIEHPAYEHTVVLGPDTVAELAHDAR